MWAVAGKRREMGLGAYPSVGLAKARTVAAACREAVADGRDPIAERKVETPTEPTFGECADRYIASMQDQWRNAKHQYQWRTTLGAYCEPIRATRVSQIGTDEVLAVLEPIWATKTETASRLRGRIERVLDFARARGWRSGENPARWRGHLQNILPSPKKAVTHLRAMPYAEVPEFLVRVRAAEAMAARCLEFTILTAARTGEALGATWAEIDLERAIWTVPGRRMKGGKEHRVPLSPRVIELLEALRALRIGDLVFPGQRDGRPLSNMAMNMFLRRLKADVTVHGFRSAFRDWCGEETDFPREVAEQALAHIVGNEVERAYRRGDALSKRRELMEEWTKYCTGKTA
jgi:integrase